MTLTDFRKQAWIIKKNIYGISIVFWFDRHIIHFQMQFYNLKMALYFIKNMEGIFLVHSKL